LLPAETLAYRVTRVKHGEVEEVEERPLTFSTLDRAEAWVRKGLASQRTQNRTRRESISQTHVTVRGY